MFESGAMTEYLCELFPDAGLGRLPGDRERAEWLTWLHFAETGQPAHRRADAAACRTL